MHKYRYCNAFFVAAVGRSYQQTFGVYQTIKQRYLGIIFDKRLNWSSHFSKVCGILFKNLPSSIVKMLTESLVCIAIGLCGNRLLLFMSAKLFPDVWLVAYGSMTMCLSVGQDLGGFQLISLHNTKVFW